MHTLNKNFGYVLIITIFLGFVPVLACLTPPPPPPGTIQTNAVNSRLVVAAKRNVLGPNQSTLETVLIMVLLLI
jgi:hypothetical protein